MTADGDDGGGARAQRDVAPARHGGALIAIAVLGETAAHAVAQSRGAAVAAAGGGGGGGEGGERRGRGRRRGRQRRREGVVVGAAGAGGGGGKSIDVGGRQPDGPLAGVLDGRGSTRRCVPARSASTWCRSRTGWRRSWARRRGSACPPTTVPPLATVRASNSSLVWYTLPAVSTQHESWHEPLGVVAVARRSGCRSSRRACAGCSPAWTCRSRTQSALRSGSVLR